MNSLPAPKVFRNVKILLFLIPVLIISMSSIAMASDDDSILASLSKQAPAGFGRMLQPNVLLLLDSSGSMTFWIGSNSSSTYTYGDGSRPYGNEDYFGRDVDPSNNDPTVDYNYHPNLQDIATEDLPSTGLSDLGSYDGKYYYPNDSRLYALKLVLWELLEDHVMTSGLNLGMATYYQYQSSTTGWYRWRPYDGYSRQTISWSYDNDEASLKVPFGSTDDLDHLAQIREWIDGEEADDNPELRANGHTPLGESIYDDYHSYSHGQDSVVDFFFGTKDGSTWKNDGAITNWCQENWLIVLTDGQETGGGDPVQAVKDLYDYADTSGWVDPMGEPAIPVRTFVIGLIAPEEYSTLVDDLNQMADYGDDGTDNDSTTAYFPTNVETLLADFREIFSIIQVRAGTGGAPLVSPARLEGQSGAVYVSTYAPREEAQWEGDLLKYALSGDVISEDADWSAAEQLNSVAYDSRSVYTVDWQDPYASTPITDSNMATFSSSEALNLRSEIFWNPDIKNLGEDVNGNGAKPTDANTRKFVRWVLGQDAWDEIVAEERWKLGDIYHSGITEVGSPRGTNPHVDYRVFKNNNQNRAPLVYVQANDGMLHAFNSVTSGDVQGGSERWAFIPPNVLGAGRLMGMRGYYDWIKNSEQWAFRKQNLQERISPRFLVDGPLVAEDVYINSSWRTILMGLLGYAGAGMYVVDITDPDEPDFLWAVDNAIYSAEDLSLKSPDIEPDRTVSYWVESGDHVARINYNHDNGNIPSALDYRDLRFTLSVPAIGSMKLNGTNRWVALMGNGSSRQIEDPRAGAVYAIDIENGEILNAFTYSDDIRGVEMSQVVTPITVLKTNNAQRIEEFYVGDNSGNVFNWELDGDTWYDQHLVSISPNVGTSYRMDLAKIDNDVWLFIVTGDYDPLVQNASQNYFVSVNTSFGGVYPIDLDDLQEVAESDDVSSSSQGWYLAFDTSVEELATTPPLIYNGYIFFSTFVADVDPCKTGNSRLYVVHAQTGASGWGGNENKYVELEGIKISGITLTGDKVFVGITNYSGSTEEDLPDSIGNLNATVQGNVIAFDVPDAVASNPFPIPSGSMVPRYWREWRP